MKAGLYARVSTREQIDNYSIESQLEKDRAFCTSKDWDIYDIYIDPGYSGSNMERPGLKRLLDDLKELDVIVVYKLDRLSRSQRDTLTLIEDYFLKNGVEFVSITETIDTSTPFGKAMIGILSVFAQLERETIAERMRNGLIKRAEEGYRVSGGNYDPAGYHLRPDGDLEIIPEEAEHIQKAAELYEQYHSITKVQAQLKLLDYPVWRFRRYRDILVNWLYAGYVSFAGEWYEGRHEVILPEEQIHRLRALFERHEGPNAHKAKQSLLSGLLVCGICGRSYVAYTSGEGYRYYICRARRFPSEYDEKCMNKNWNGKKLEKKVIDELSRLSFDKESRAENPEVINYDKQAKAVDAKMERIVGLYASNSISKNILDNQIEQLNQEKEMLYKKSRQQKEQINARVTAEEIKQFHMDLQLAEFDEKQAIIQRLIHRIVVHGERLEIEWTF